MRWKIFLSLTLILFVAITGGCRGGSRAEEIGWKVYHEARDEALKGILKMLFSSDEKWIQDRRTGVYVWNPEPVDGESMEWSGNAIRDGDKLYAHGKGGIVWYINGRAVQIDEGYFDHGKQQGRFMHFLPNNKVFYTEWNNGKMIEQ